MSLKNKRIALIGQPNVGKSVVFGCLTGKYVTVSNYPGTTVEVARGTAKIGEHAFEVIDTPGLYSIFPITEEEKVTLNIIEKERPAAIMLAFGGQTALNCGVALHDSGVFKKYNVKVISEPQKGYAYALTSGFRGAKGEIVCVTDADSIVPQNWVSQICQHFKKEPTAVAFGGNLELCDCIEILRQASKIICRFNYHYLSGANMAIKKEAFFKASKGKLRVNFGAELYLVKRLKKLGKIIFDPNLTVKTSGRRLEADLPRTLSTYFLNDLWLYLFDKPRYENFTDIRKLKIAESRKTLPVLLKTLIDNFKTQSRVLGTKVKATFQP